MIGEIGAAEFEDLGGGVVRIAGNRRWVVAETGGGGGHGRIGGGMKVGEMEGDWEGREWGI